MCSESNLGSCKQSPNQKTTTAVLCCWPADRPGDSEGHVSGEIRCYPEGCSGFGVWWRLQAPPHWDPALKRLTIFLQASSNKHDTHSSFLLLFLFFVLPFNQLHSLTLWTFYHPRHMFIHLSLTSSVVFAARTKYQLFIEWQCFTVSAYIHSL